MTTAAATHVLSSGGVTATVDSDRGAAVRALSLPDGQQVLDSVSGELRDRVVREDGACDAAHHSKARWIAASEGGWEIMAPNAGDAGVAGDVWHEFHGVAGRVPWQVVEQQPERIFLRAECESTAHERAIEVGYASCEITETIRSTSDRSQPFAWGSHVTLGQHMTAGALRLELPGVVLAGDVDGVVLPAQDLADWLQAPRQGHSAMAYVDALGVGRACLTNTTAGLRATVEWDTRTFPFLWVWVELGGTHEWPWYGQLHALGIEPVSVWPGSGVPELVRTGRAPTLAPGAAHSGTVRLCLDWSGTTQTEDSGNGD